MKVVSREIEMIAWFKKTDMPVPVKFRIESESKNSTIKIDKVIQAVEEKLAGNRMYVYRCQSIIGDRERIYELKYEIGTCKWFLFKI
ncbi:MAG: hypothetical protein HGA49_09595 [Eubacteriaceae bacterium]|nr:hypothetical protein [Eubacteriaceae bacterium]